VAQNRVRELQENGVQREAQSEQQRLLLLLGLLFHGTSLRGAAECLRLAFGASALGKSAIAERLIKFCGAAETLFNAYFAGMGKSAACDEIYISGHPVLEVVEPRSLAITGIVPNTQPTELEWKKLLQSFKQLESGISDQGRGVSSALAAHLIRHGFDIWHLLRHFGAAVGHMEAQSYERMQDEDRKRDLFLASLPFEPGGDIPRELTRLEESQRKCEKSIKAYDDASTVLGWLYEAVQPIDAQGRVRTPQQIQGDWKAALDLVDHIDAPSLYPLEKKLRDKVDGACAIGLAERLQAVSLPSGWHEVEREELQRRVCQAWRYHHKNRTHLLEAPLQAARTVATQLGQAFTAAHLETYCNSVFEILDAVLIASSSVECVNSVIRLRQGGKRHPYPGFVYLLAWLHNTRPFTEAAAKV